jgi:hypothetical protein
MPATRRNRLAAITATIAWTFIAPIAVARPDTSALATVLVLLGSAAAASYTDARRKDPT